MMRSSLYVPGDRPERFERALSSGADAVIFDLEDAVAPTSKEAAREHVVEMLLTRRDVADSFSKSPMLCVRINQGERGFDDAAAVLEAGSAGLGALFAPKVNDVEDVMALNHVMDRAESVAKLGPKSVVLVALIESATGVFNASSIASHPRVARLAIGEVDLAAELGVELSPGDERELHTARSLLVLASAAAAIDPPIGPVSVDFKNLSALRESSEKLRRFGFRGRSAIHPDQVAVINEVFTPSVTQLRSAERVLEIFDAAMAAGRGVVADDSGKMIDEAVVRSARRIVAQRDVI